MKLKVKTEALNKKTISFSLLLLGAATSLIALPMERPGENNFLSRAGRRDAGEEARAGGARAADENTTTEKDDEQTRRATVTVKEEDQPLSIDEVIKEDIRGNIYTTCLAEVAISSGQEFQSALSKIVDALQARQGIGNIRTAPAMRLLSLAEEKWNVAQNADIDARVAKGKAHDMNLERETVAYQAAEHSWLQAVEAYNDILKESSSTMLSNVELKTALQDDLNKAKLKAFLWASQTSWIEARKIEQRLKQTTIHQDDAEEAKNAWAETIEEYQSLLQKIDDAALDPTGWTSVLADAQTRYALWSEKLVELQKTATISNPEELAEARLKKLERKKRRDDRLAREAVWSEESQRAYEQFELPDEIPGLKFHHFEASEIDEIIPPLQLSETLEKIGKRLLREEANIQSASPLIETSSSSSSSRQTLNSHTPKAAADSGLLPSQLEAAAKKEIFNLSRYPLPEQKEQNDLRIAALSTAKRLRLEAAAKIEAALDQAEEAAPATEADDKITKAGGKTVASRWRAQLSEAGRTTQTQTTSMTAAPSELLTLQFGNTAHEAETAWEEMVRATEKTRVENGGIALTDPDLILELWEKADNASLSARAEEAKSEQQKKVAAKFKSTWASKTARWKARVRVDEAEIQAQAAEKEHSDLEQETTLLHANDEASRSVKKAADEKTTIAATIATEARAMATEIENEWIALASQHHIVRTAQHQGEEAIKFALVKIKAADQAIHDLWFEVSLLTSEEEFEEVEDPTIEETRRNKLAAAYPAQLLTKRTTDKATCFANVDATHVVAKEKYAKAKTNVAKETAHALYDVVDKKEIAAWEKYTQLAEETALNDARKKTPGAAAAWAQRAAHSEKERDTQAKANSRKAPCVDTWADDNQRALMRATAIAAADEVAFKAFEREETRLADVATLWIAILEAQKRGTQKKCEAAAEAHQQGNPTAWENLTSEERGDYNWNIIQANNVYETELSNKIKDAQNREEFASQTLDAMWSFSLWRSRAVEALHQSREVIIELQSEAAKRKEALRWPSLTSAQRAAERAAAERAAAERAAAERATALALVKALASRPWKYGFEARLDGANEIMALVRTTLWPIMSNEMKAFTLQPSEERLLAVRKSASASASATATGDELVYCAVSASVYATATATASLSAFAFAVAYAKGSIFASASASASTFVSLSASSTLTTAQEAAEAAEAATAGLKGSESAVDFYKRSRSSETPIIQRLHQTLERTRKLVKFARAVAAFKARQEAASSIL